MPPHRILTHFRAYHLTPFRRNWMPSSRPLAPTRYSWRLFIAPMPFNALPSSFNASSLPFNASLPPVMHPVILKQNLSRSSTPLHCLFTILHHSLTLSHHHLTHLHRHLTLPRRILMPFNTPVAFKRLSSPFTPPHCPFPPLRCLIVPLQCLLTLIHWPFNAFPFPFTTPLRRHAFTSLSKASPSNKILVALLRLSFAFSRFFIIP